MNSNYFKEWRPLKQKKAIKRLSYPKFEIIMLNLKISVQLLSWPRTLTTTWHKISWKIRLSLSIKSPKTFIPYAKFTSTDIEYLTNRQKPIKLLSEYVTLHKNHNHVDQLTGQATQCLPCESRRIELFSNPENLCSFFIRFWNTHICVLYFLNNIFQSVCLVVMFTIKFTMNEIRNYRVPVWKSSERGHVLWPDRSWLMTLTEIF